MSKEFVAPPSQVIGAYVLHLYCGDCHRYDEFIGQNKPEAIRHAKLRGWDVRFARGYARCPNHTLAAKLTTAQNGGEREG